jgi:RHS repeat-associated protein
VKSADERYTVQYRYGEDGERTVKYTEGVREETVYFNRMWQMRSSGADPQWLQTKHIFVGETRIASKNGYGGINAGYETSHQYWYHGDHLGSAQVVTDHEGQLYERIEYTPYGEAWIEHKYGGEDLTAIPYRFTGKEQDEETGLYYYGARYLDPQTSRWLSTDPAMGEYIPQAPVNEEARKRNGNLPGMGGVFNVVNLHVYHYAGNNPVRYVDPDGERINQVNSFIHQNASDNRGLNMGPIATYDWDNDPNSRNTIGEYGCLFTCVINIGNTENLLSGGEFKLVSDYSGTDSYYINDKKSKTLDDGTVITGTDQNMDSTKIKTLLKDATGRNFFVTRISGNEKSRRVLNFFNNAKTLGAYLIANVDGHFVNVLGIDKDGKVLVHNPLVGKDTSFSQSDIKGLYVVSKFYVTTNW